MKKMNLYPISVFAVFCILFYSSCKKNNSQNSSQNNTPSQLPPATFSFKCNGIAYQWDGDVSIANPNAKGSKIWAKSFGTNIPKILCLTGSNGLDQSDPTYFTFSVPVTSYDLGVTHSSPDLAAVGTLGTISYGHLSNVYVNFHITFSFVNSDYANGSFDAILFPIGDPSLPTLNITDGAFSYVKRLN